ncbi:ubiquitin carboxyl-terminal hydrolase CYLD isoform X1 [Oncorhynchus nerka]|uniref:ubiquitin carboxyl-terminal hydrolase CYLD isoform X1 n=2 Tax=Oncorhynchus nerka TaxID=8023 RepID=UPI0031B892D9
MDFLWSMDTCDVKMYFIIIEEPGLPMLLFNAGHICYIQESRYMSMLSRSACLQELPVICMGSSNDRFLKVNHLKPVTAKEAELLQALGEDSERLKWYLEKDALATALGLTKDTPVTVELDGKWLQGIVRYVGRLTEPKITNPIVGTFFGIELQGEDKGKGSSDGTYLSKTLFPCKKDCGIFAPFSRVKPMFSKPKLVSKCLTFPAAQLALQPSSQQAQHQPLSTGDRVTFFMDEDILHGMVMDLEEKDGKTLVIISTDRDEKITLPLDSVIKGELLQQEPEPMETDTAVMSMGEVHPLGLGVDSLVEVTLAIGPGYGTIRWIGTLPGQKGTYAGLELEDGYTGVSNGTFKDHRFFRCLPRQGLFVKLLSCRPDSRFQGASANVLQERQALRSPGALPSSPIASDQVERMLIGRMKGIQGHINSCYMDSALFSLFSCSSVLDSLLFKSTEPRDAPIQSTLLHDIVNPLRSEGFVEGRHIMKLRQQLQELGYCHTFTTEEKDPEEFLTLIMHHIFCLDPLLKLSAGGKVQDSYCYQIFLDNNHSLVLPTVQHLLEHSFHSAGLKLAEVPSCLILQMPRFGKKFKMFQKIIPTLELDITDLLSEGPQQCVLCGQLAYEECVDCFRDPVFSRTGFKVFCRTCSSQVHSHPERLSHSPSPLQLPEGYPAPTTLRPPPPAPPRERLELFAVLCIETSHYVSFIKHGPNSTDWIFFDSMADRHGERDGFNIPQVEACPEVGMYLVMSPAELANQVPRDMKGVAKRLFCDAYMYLYQSTSISLYR